MYIINRQMKALGISLFRNTPTNEPINMIGMEIKAYLY